MNKLKCLLLLAITLCLPLPACALSGKAIEGQALEEGTNKPAPEAIVVVRWIGDLFAFAESQTVCVHVLTTATDAEGKYHLPAWRKKSEIGWVRDVRPVITVHKPGYEEYRAPGYVRTEAFKQNVRYLKPFTGTREEKLKFIERIKQSTVSCADPKANGENLIPLYRALYEEAKPLARTRDEQSIADGFLSWINILERGSGK